MACAGSYLAVASRGLRPNEIIRGRLGASSNAVYQTNYEAWSLCCAFSSLSRLELVTRYDTNGTGYY